MKKFDLTTAKGREEWQREGKVREKTGWTKREYDRMVGRLARAQRRHRGPLVEPLSAAIFAAEQTGKLTPLLKALRSAEPLTEAGRAMLADALERWKVKPFENEDGLLAAAEEFYRELVPTRGHLAKMARTTGRPAADLRDDVLWYIAGDAVFKNKFERYLNRTSKAGKRWLAKKKPRP